MAEKRAGAGSPWNRLSARGQLYIALTGLVLVFVLGALGYHWVEGWPLSDGLYMVLITLATIGYGEVRPLSEAGRWFTMGLIVVGIGNFALIISYYTQALADGSLLRATRRRRLDRQLARLSGHCILCGYGRIGEVVADELALNNQELVIIESDEKRRPALERGGFLHVMGDATSDETLRRAGIERAACLVSTMASDAENVYVTLSARHMNGALRIVSSAGQNSGIDKLRKAGADEVLMPHVIGGSRLALAAFRPSAVAFIEKMKRQRGDCLLEEVRLAEGSPLTGKTGPHFGPIRSGDVQVVGVRRGEGPFVFAPAPDFVFAADDVLLVAGVPESLRDAVRFLGVVSD